MPAGLAKALPVGAIDQGRDRIEPVHARLAPRLGGPRRLDREPDRLSASPGSAPDPAIGLTSVPVPDAPSADRSFGHDAVPHLRAPRSGSAKVPAQNGTPARMGRVSNRTVQRDAAVTTKGLPDGGAQDVPRSRAAHGPVAMPPTRPVGEARRMAADPPRAARAGMSVLPGGSPPGFGSIAKPARTKI